VQLGLCSDGLVPILEEAYDVLPPSTLDWEMYVDDGATATNPEGALTVSIDLGNVTGTYAYVGFTAVPAVPARGTGGVELLLAPEDTAPGEIFMGIHDGTRIIFISLNEGQLEAIVGDPMDVYTALASIAYDPNVHGWMRMRWDEGADTVDFETSFDGQSWDSFHTMSPTGFEFGQATFELGSGVWDSPFSADPFTRLDNAFLCED
jgi:hypothetical protein